MGALASFVYLIGRVLISGVFVYDTFVLLQSPGHGGDWVTRIRCGCRAWRCGRLRGCASTKCIRNAAPGCLTAVAASMRLVPWMVYPFDNPIEDRHGPAR